MHCRPSARHAFPTRRLLTLLSLALLAALAAACSSSGSPTESVPTLAPPTATLQAAAPEATVMPASTETGNPPLISTSEATAASATAESTDEQLYMIREPIPGPACAISPVGGPGVNIRREPTKDSEVLGGLLRGAWVLARGLDASALWFQISAPNTPVDGGWVTSTGVAIRGVCNCTPGGSCERGQPIPSAVPASAATTEATAGS